MVRMCFLLMLIFAGNVSAIELGIVSMVRNEAPYISEWLEYHRLMGVEHFWLYDNHSTDNTLDVLQPYIEEGIVEVKYWPTPAGCPNYISTQIRAFKDGIRNAQGKAEWIAMVDVDEFIVPMKDQTIIDCLRNHFSKKEAIYANWRNFSTSGVNIPKGDPIIFQLTKCSLRTHPTNSIGKTIVRPECVNLDEVWYAHHFPLFSDDGYANGDRQTLYFERKDYLIGGKQPLDLILDGKHHDKYIRINHYPLRDEWFYENSRLANAKQGFGDVSLLQEHYISFSLTEDFSIIDLIQVMDTDNILKSH